MPTRADFETAAELFQSASAQVGGIADGADSAAAAQILQGGSLGRQVPERIASAATSARTCQTLIDAAAETCATRAGIILAYEDRLAAYDLAKANYQKRALAYRSALDRWFLDKTGKVKHPGEPPVQPTKPDPPPAWAEVRRP